MTPEEEFEQWTYSLAADLERWAEEVEGHGPGSFKPYPSAKKMAIKLRMYADTRKHDDNL